MNVPTRTRRVSKPPDWAHLTLLISLLLVWALPLAGSESPSLRSTALRTELAQLAALLDDPRLGENADRLRPAYTEATAALEAGRPHWALQRMMVGRVQTEAYLFMRANKERASDMAGFDRIWHAHAGILRQVASADRLTVCGQARALVRAMVEAASNRASRHYHAARAIAQTGDEPWSGLFYLGRARAELDLVRLCVIHGVEAQAEEVVAGPPVADLRGSLRKLEDAVGVAYADGDAATQHHATFIRLNARVKELRELVGSGLGFGALDAYLGATLRLALVRDREIDPPEKIRRRATLHGQRLASLAGDHSLAHAYLERANTVLAGEEDDQRLATEIVGQVLPAYFALLGSADAGERIASRQTVENPVTVTLLRWPYT